MSLFGFEWNEAELGRGISELNRGLIVIVAFTPNRKPKLIGTAFIISSEGSKAYAITAAHNFDGVIDAQSSKSNVHRSALPEFLGDLNSIDLNHKNVRALCYTPEGVEVSTISLVLWDKQTDVALFSIEKQNEQSTVCYSNFNLSETSLSIGDDIALLGYAGMEVSDEYLGSNGFESFAVSQRLTLRMGKVTDVHPDGHILCRGPCIETSIPVFSGMSGGPVFRMGKNGEPIKPFGIISSDSEASLSQKNNRSIKGSSIIALLNTVEKRTNSGLSKVTLTLENALREMTKET